MIDVEDDKMILLHNLIVLFFGYRMLNKARFSLLLAVVIY